MQSLNLLPCRFNSNIYSYREILSDYLKSHVLLRLMIDDYVCTPDDILLLDSYLIKYHYRFIEVKKAIEVLEKDVYVFGS